MNSRDIVRIEKAIARCRMVRTNTSAEMLRAMQLAYELRQEKAATEMKELLKIDSVDDVTLRDRVHQATVLQVLIIYLCTTRSIHKILRHIRFASFMN